MDSTQKLRKWLWFMVINGLLLCHFAQAQDRRVKKPRRSPAAVVSQTIGLSQVTINYSRPAARKRRVWGKVVPYGLSKSNFGNKRPMPWRAGANENTVFTTTHRLKIGDKTLPAGSYGLHMVVDASAQVTVIFSKNYTSWGSFFYDVEDDALRITTQLEDYPVHTENLMYVFENIRHNAATVGLLWGKKKISFKVTFATHQIVLASMKNDLKTYPGFFWEGPLSAAQYCVDYNIALAQALAWVDQSIQIRATFANNREKATILLRQGKTKEAIIYIDKAVPMGSIFQLHGLGRQLIRAQMPKKAMEVFKYNYQNHKDTPVTINFGMMRGYSALGEYKKALKYAKAALEHVPAHDKSNQRQLAEAIKKLKNNQDMN